MTAGSRALVQSLAGLSLWGAGLALAQGLPAPVEGGTPPGASAAAPDAPVAPGEPGEPAPAPAPPRAAQTPLGSEPPAVVGPAWDDDAALPAHAATVASYAIEARLDAATHVVTGHETLTWQNASTRPANELYFHLYLNAFKNNRTVFLRSPFGAGRSGNGGTHWGWMDVSRLTIAELGADDLFPHGARSDEDPDDETCIRVPLPRPAAAGERLTIRIDWTAQLPEIVERTGYVRDFHLVGQWFPKIARREPDGAFRHFPFHAQSEFYSDFGAYDVSLDVPEHLVVGATGGLVSEEIAAGRKKLRYVAEDVHDFAWTAWEHFQERRETTSGVDVRLLFPPGNDRNADATLAAVRHGLAHYGAAYGRYPYRNLTVVHPPEFAPSAGGMEYPTFITTGFPWYTSLVSTFVERVTLHELGHQWFYGLVATDEHAFPFLDEGLTTHAESSAMAALFGPGNGFHAPGLDVDGDAYQRLLAADAAADGIVARPAADFATFRELGALVYARTGIALATLGRTFGEEALRTALGRYARRYRFAHPGPRHLMAVVGEVMGEDAAALLQGALLEGGTVDFAVTDLKSLPTRAPRGVFDEPGGRATRDGAAGEAPATRFTSRVIVHRRGALRVPVDVELRFEDGSHEVRHWDGRGRSVVLEADGPSRLVGALVDPERRVLLDDDLTNNRTAASRGSAPRVTERALYAAALLLGAVGP